MFYGLTLLAITTGAVIGSFATSAWLYDQEVRIVTDEPVTCVVELNQAAGLNQQTIIYEGKVK